jgi:imidazolonepropionase-like amidohydrolase
LKGANDLGQTLFLKAGTLIDGTGGPALKDVLLEVREGKVASITPARPDDLAGIRYLDFSGLTVIPGLVDVHVHLFMSGTADADLRAAQLERPYGEASEVIAHHLTQQLKHGVVAVRDGADRNGHTLRFVKQALPLRGLPIRVRTAGRAFRAPGRYGKLIGRPVSQGHTLAEAIEAESEGIDHVKIVNSGLNSLTIFGRETAPQFDLDQLSDAVQRAHGLGLKVMVHANGRAPVMNAVEAGCDSIEHGFFMGQRNLARMAERGTVWVPTAFTMEAYWERLEPGTVETAVARRTFEHQLAQIAAAHEKGVDMATGTDAGSLGVDHGAALGEEIGILMTAGLSLEKAIRCATLQGARLLGLEKELGSLVKGMPATFVAVPGPPERFPSSLKGAVMTYVHGEKVSDEHPVVEARSVS